MGLRDKFKSFAPNIAGILLASTSLAACSGGGANPVQPSIPDIVAPPSLPDQPPEDGNPDDFKTDEYNTSWGLGAINAANAYALGYTGKDIIIGFVDYNFDFDSDELNFHPASRGVDPALQAIYEAQFGEPASDSPHGQAVAVTAAGVKNDEGIHGVAYDAQVLAVDFFSGVNSYQTTTNGILYTISNPYLYALENGARVINKSLGFDEDDIVSNLPDVDERYTLDYETIAVNAGALLVVSAGNNSDPEPSLSNLEALDRLFRSGTLENGPGAYIIAGAVDENLEIASFSDQAGDSYARNYYLVAPGVDIIAPWVTEADGPGLYYLNGTSFAAPYISGAAALILDRWPSLTAKEVAEILFETATDLGAPGTDSIYGRGLVNLDLALQPVGTSSLATPVGKAPIRGSALSLGPAFGDAASLKGSLSSVMLLDGYDRDFQIDASDLISHRGKSANLENRLNHRRAWTASNLSLAGQTLQYSLGLDDRATPAFALAGQAENDFTSEINATFEFTGTLGNTSWILGTGRNLTEALKRSPVDYRQAYTLSLTGANDNALPQTHSNYMAIARTLSDKSTLLFGAAVGETDGSANHPVAALQADRPTYSIAARLQQYHDRHDWSVELGILREEDAVLGSRSAGGLALTGGAQTAWLNLEADWYFSDLFSAHLAGTGTATLPDQGTGTLFDNVGTLWGSSFTAKLRGQSLLHVNDQLTLSLHQPLRIERAIAELALGQSLDSEGNVIFANEHISLTPSAREIAVELAYSLKVSNWFLEANAGHRMNANHTSGQQDTLMMIGLSRPF